MDIKEEVKNSTKSDSQIKIEEDNNSKEKLLKAGSDKNKFSNSTGKEEDPNVDHISNEESELFHFDKIYSHAIKYKNKNKRIKAKLHDSIKLRRKINSGPVLLSSTYDIMQVKEISEKASMYWEKIEGNILPTGIDGEKNLDLKANQIPLIQKEEEHFLNPSEQTQQDNFHFVDQGETEDEFISHSLYFQTMKKFIFIFLSFSIPLIMLAIMNYSIEEDPTSLTYGQKYDNSLYELIMHTSFGKLPSRYYKYEVMIHTIYSIFTCIFFYIITKDIKDLFIFDRSLAQKSSIFIVNHSNHEICLDQLTQKLTKNAYYFGDDQESLNENSLHIISHKNLIIQGSKTIKSILQDKFNIFWNDAFGKQNSNQTIIKNSIGYLTNRHNINKVYFFEVNFQNMETKLDEYRKFEENIFFGLFAHKHTKLSKGSNRLEILEIINCIDCKKRDSLAKLFLLTFDFKRRKYLNTEENIISKYELINNLIDNIKKLHKDECLNEKQNKKAAKMQQNHTKESKIFDLSFNQNQQSNSFQCGVLEYNDKNKNLLANNSTEESKVIFTSTLQAEANNVNNKNKRLLKPHQGIIIAFSSPIFKKFLLNHYDTPDPIKDNDLKALKKLGIKFSEPPPKEDIILENVGSRKGIFRRPYITFVICFLLIIINVYLNYGLENLKRSKGHFLIVILSSLLISIGNTIIDRVIEKLNKCEKHLSYSGQDSSYIIKASLLVFFHTTLLAIFINIKSFKDFFVNHEFYEVIFIFFIYTIFLFPFTNSILSIPWGLYFYRRIIIAFWKKFSLNKISSLNMDSAQSLVNHTSNTNISFFLALFYARPEFQYFFRYSYRIFILWLTVFLVPLYPLIVVFPLISFAIEYFIDFILIKFKIYRNPRSISPKLNHYFLVLIRCSYLIYLGSTIYYFRMIKITFFIYFHLTFFLLFITYFLIIIFRDYWNKEYESFFSEFKSIKCKFMTILLIFLNPFDSTYEMIEMATRKFLSGYIDTLEYENAEDFQRQFQLKVKYNEYSFKIPKLIGENIEEKTPTEKIKYLENQISDYLNTASFHKLL